MAEDTQQTLVERLLVAKASLRWTAKIRDEWHNKFLQAEAACSKKDARIAAALDLLGDVDHVRQCARCARVWGVLLGAGRG